MNGKYYFSWFSVIHSHFSCTFYFLILGCFNGVLCISSPNRFSVSVSNCSDPCPKAVLSLTIDLVRLGSDRFWTEDTISVNHT